MKIYIIAGEQSGDYIGSKIMKALDKRAQAKNIVFSYLGVGGDLMNKQGLRSLFPMNKISLFGFIEIIPHFFSVLSLINKTVNDICEYKPDIVISIDSPGFTYRVCRKVRKKDANIRLLHVVAPSVWAYKPERAKKYADLYDHLLTLYQFEVKYFTKEGLDTHCIGQPFLEQDFQIDRKDSLRIKFSKNQDKKLIAITPGSRAGEINRHMPIITKALEDLNKDIEIKAIFIQSNSNNYNLISSFLSKSSFKYMLSTEKLDAFAAADCALAKSGTNTLEIAAAKTPMIIAYKLNIFSYWFVKLVIKIRFACIINIIADKEIIPEFLQNDFTAQKLSTALNFLLKDSQARNKQLTQTEAIIDVMRGGAGNIPSEKAADIIYKILQNTK